MVRRGSTVRVRQRASRKSLLDRDSSCLRCKRLSLAGTRGVFLTFARRSRETGVLGLSKAILIRSDPFFQREAGAVAGRARSRRAHPGRLIADDFLSIGPTASCSTSTKWIGRHVHFTYHALDVSEMDIRFYNTTATFARSSGTGPATRIEGSSSPSLAIVPAACPTTRQHARRHGRRRPARSAGRWDRRRPRIRTSSRPTAAAGRTPSRAPPSAPRTPTLAVPRGGRAG